MSFLTESMIQDIKDSDNYIRYPEMSIEDYLQEEEKHMAELGEPPLTETQRDYVLEVLELVENGAAGCMVLQGPAGTGKTTVLVWILNVLARMRQPAAVGTPTHKAAKVLREKLEKTAIPSDDPEEAAQRPAAEPRTVHSLLNLKMRRGAGGGPMETYQSSTPDLGEYSLLVVDECSMIGADLFLLIQASCAAAGLPVLYSGDSCQLRPVNGARKVSPTFSGGKVLELTEVLRHDGAILDLATKIRVKGFVPVIRAARGENSEVAVHWHQKAMERAWLQELIEGGANPDDVVMLTYTNEARRAFNDKARKAIHGPDVARYLPGDELLALNPVVRGNQVLVHNNDTVVLTSVEFIEGFEPLFGLGAEIATWKLETTRGITLYVVDDGAVEKLKATLAAIKSKIVRETNAVKKKIKAARHPVTICQLQGDLEEAKRGWRLFYYPLAEFYADLDYKYALTIHKSQGSQWKEVFVNDDYMKSRDEHVQLLYVAATRAEAVLNHVDNAPVRGGTV